MVIISKLLSYVPFHEHYSQSKFMLSEIKQKIQLVVSTGILYEL